MEVCAREYGAIIAQGNSFYLLSVLGIKGSRRCLGSLMIWCNYQPCVCSLQLTDGIV